MIGLQDRLHAMRDDEDRSLPHNLAYIGVDLAFELEVDGICRFS
jgi:hypothetical protein